MTSTLKNKRIIITRTREQSAELAALLAEKGAETIAFPTIEICDPDSWEPLDQALTNIGDYSWVIFTSVNGVKKFFERLQTLQIKLPAPPPFKVAAIGPATGRMIISHGMGVEFLPEDFMAEGLVASLQGRILPGMKILIPRALEAREILPEELRRMGAIVDVIPVYQTVIPLGRMDQFHAILQQNGVAMIVFTSSSTIINLGKMVSPQSLPDVLKNLSIACIGPITAATASKSGLRVSVMPLRFDLPALVESIEQFFANQSKR
jgi:uroporphyrinogen III methyltransferase / synthase